jgi:fucose 4-O-acetylase-like acetyltransferase
MKNMRDWISKSFNFSVLQRNRYNWVDYLRGIVIILVVYHHTYLGIERSGVDVPAAVGEANMVFYSFRMPLFFIISGIFTFFSLQSKSVRSIVWSKFNILFYPYIVWSFLQISLQIILSEYTNAARTYADYLYIFYQPKQLDQFWYLPALFNSTIVYVFIKTRLKPTIGVHLLIGLGLYLWSPFLVDISMISNWMRFYLFFVIGEAVSTAITNKRLQEKLMKPPIVGIFLLVFSIAQYFYLHDNVGVKAMEISMENFGGDYTAYWINEANFLFTSLIGCATLVIIAFILQRWDRLKWLRVVGYHSLYIYIIHVLVVAVVRIIFTKTFKVEYYLPILLMAILFGVITPIIFYNLLGKKYLWFLFSTRRPVREKAISGQNLIETTVPLPQTQLKPGINNN